MGIGFASLLIAQHIKMSIIFFFLTKKIQKNKVIGSNPEVTTVSTCRCFFPIPNLSIEPNDNTAENKKVSSYSTTVQYRSEHSMCEARKISEGKAALYLLSGVQLLCDCVCDCGV